MSILYILGHLGLGDMLLINGIVRHRASVHTQIKLPCYEHNLQAVSFMFSDLPNVEAIPIKDEAAAMLLCDGKSCLRLGFYSKEPQVEGKDRFNRAIFDQEFYRQAGLPFSDRWDRFKLPDVKRSGLDEPVCFIHSDPRRGYLVDVTQHIGGMPAYHPSDYRPFFDHLDALKNAGQIHCINSSFLILADSLPDNPDQKLFFHHYARPTDYPTLKRNWTIL